MEKLSILCLLIFAITSEVEAENLIANPGFEIKQTGDLPSGWNGIRGEPKVKNDGGHSGKNYLRMIDDGPKESLYLMTRRVTARPGGKYTATVWTRSNDKGKPGIYINFYNTQGSRIQSDHVRSSGTKKGEWELIEMSATAPDDAANITVNLYSFAGDQGTYDFDDAELQVEGGRDPFATNRLKGKISKAVDIGSRRELFVDRFLIDQMKGARLTLNRPRDEGIALKFDKAWEGRFCGYCTVFKTDSGYRVYYRGRAGLGKDGDNSEVTSIANSKDGINWTRPKLNLYEFNGHRDNNIVLTDASPYTHNFSPWLDTRPGVPKNQRYKAMAGIHSSGVGLFASADGLSWKILKEKILTSKEFAFDSQACAFWSESENQYICYFRTWKNKVRWISRSTSKDALKWTEPVEMSFGDAPAEHLYTNQTHPYFRAPHLYISTAARFVPGRQVVTEEEARAINVNPKYFKDTSDAVLVTSRGGNVYDRTFLTSFVRPAIGAKNWVSRTNYPALNIVQTGPTEMSLYVNQDYAQPTAHLHRYSMRLDGFASVQAEYSGGELLTRPFTFSGKKLTLNFATSAAGSIRVEFQTQDGKPIPGFSAIECREQIGNEIERTVRWNGGSDVSSLAGKPVRLRFVMKDADLFALKFSK